MIDHEESPKKSILNIVINVVLPTLIFTKLSKPDRLGPIYSLALGLAIPIVYGVYTYLKEKKKNFVSLLGIASLGLTGGLALLNLSGIWLAFKEMMIPFLIGLFFIFGRHSKYNMIDLILLNPKLMKLDLLDTKIKEGQLEEKFLKIKNQSMWIFIASFFVSAILNFVLAIVIVKAPAGTVEFTEQIGKMTGLSFIFISIPSMLMLGIAFWFFAHHLKKMTGESFEFFLKDELK